MHFESILHTKVLQCYMSNESETSRAHALKMTTRINHIRSQVREVDLPKICLPGHYLNLGISQFLDELSQGLHRRNSRNKEALVERLERDVKNITQGLVQPPPDVDKEDWLLKRLSSSFYLNADEAVSKGLVKLPADTLAMLALQYPAGLSTTFGWVPSARNPGALMLRNLVTNIDHAFIFVRSNFGNTELSYTAFFHGEYRNGYPVFPTLGDAKKYLAGKIHQRHQGCEIMDTGWVIPPQHRSIFSTIFIVLKRFFGRL